MDHFDYILIGGGIVGISTALALKNKFPEAKIVLIEKESKLATHQTGHNSGVVHAGVYYEPGSLKAAFCKEGARLIQSFCEEYQLPYRKTGKLLVATDEIEFERMKALKARCHINDIRVDEISRKQLNQMEPKVTGEGALLVHETAITDYPRICLTMAGLFQQKGGVIQTGQSVTMISERAEEVVVKLETQTVRGQFLIACAGLQADRVAQLMDIRVDFRIVPFRGEYYQLPSHLNQIVSRLIYPIPDPELPFLGVHLTPMINGSVTVGPNAVLGFKREGYGAVNFDLKDVFNMVTYRGFWKVISKNLRSGLGEMIDSVHKTGYLKRIQKYCPSLGINDLLSYPAGIRAQAVKSDGTLVHDFLFAQSPRSLHVCNAPSPAATSAIPIGEYICEKLDDVNV